MVVEGIKRGGGHQKKGHCAAKVGPKVAGGEAFDAPLFMAERSSRVEGGDHVLFRRPIGDDFAIPRVGLRRGE